jgi:hypothetical protein
VAEKYSPELKELLLSNPDDAHELAARMRSWRVQMDRFKRLTVPVAEQLRSHSWRDMAAQIVTLAQAGAVTQTTRSFSKPMAPSDFVQLRARRGSRLR